MALTTGDKIGPYEVLGEMGAGGMGVVFRARDERLGRVVALKSLPEATAADPERLRRFEQECQAVGALNHPNVVSVFDVGKHEGTPYLVTELLDGVSLRQRLREGPFPPRKAAELAAQVARGLAAVHDRGIVHRDLKPDNLFLTRDGQVKILDFGVSRAMEQLAMPASTLPLTASGAVLGTAGYMAPEQVRGHPADARADIFALGAILYELLTGELAFPGETGVERGYAVLNTDPKEPAAFGLRLSPALERVMRRCLEKSPEERFQSARDLAFALEAITEGSQERTAETTPPLPRGSRWTWAAVAAALAVGLGAGLFAWGRRGAAASTTAQPSFTRLTFRSGAVGPARFASGNRVVYSAALEGEPTRVYSASPGNPNVRSMLGDSVGLLDVSSRDELAVRVRAPTEQRKPLPVLARVALAGGAPRQVMEGISGADFSPDGNQLLVVRPASTRLKEDAAIPNVIEYPLGRQIHSAEAAIGVTRISPSGDRVAFSTHPVREDDRGYVNVIDLEGTVVARSPDWWTLEGLAWSPDGREVWFSAANRDVHRAIYAMNMKGEVRLVLRAPGTLVLHDLDEAGRALVVRESFRKRMFGLVNSEPTSTGPAREENLSWFDGSAAVDLTEDGKTLLFIEGLGAGESEVQAYLRRFDGSGAVHLGPGWPRALSPDGKWAVVSPEPPFNTLALVPTGPGQTRSLPMGKVSQVLKVRFFPDGQRIGILGRSTDGRTLFWVQALEGEEPKPQLEDEVLDFSTASADGRWVVVRRANGEHELLELGEAPAEVSWKSVNPSKVAFPLQCRYPQCSVISWAAGGDGVLLARAASLTQVFPLQIWRHDFASGPKLVRELTVSDPVGVQGLRSLVMTPDGKWYAYSVPQRLGELYLVEGLR